MSKAKPPLGGLRVLVATEAEKELVSMAEAADADSKLFLEGLRAIGEQWRQARAARPALSAADRAFRLITEGVQMAEAAMAEAPETMAVLDLRTVVEALSDLPAFQRHRFGHHPELPPDDDEGSDLRRDVVQHFAHRGSLYPGRLPSIRELAAISLYLDPDHGCSPRRVARDEGTTVRPLVTYYDVVKMEMDAIRRLIERDPAGAAYETRDTP